MPTKLINYYSVNLFGRSFFLPPFRLSHSNSPFGWLLFSSRSASKTMDGELDRGAQRASRRWMSMRYFVVQRACAVPVQCVNYSLLSSQSFSLTRVATEHVIAGHLAQCTNFQTWTRDIAIDPECRARVRERLLYAEMLRTANANAMPGTHPTEVQTFYMRLYARRMFLLLVREMGSMYRCAGRIHSK